MWMWGSNKHFYFFVMFIQNSTKSIKYFSKRKSLFFKMSLLIFYCSFCVEQCRKKVRIPHTYYLTEQHVKNINCTKQCILEFCGKNLMFFGMSRMHPSPSTKAFYQAKNCKFDWGVMNSYLRKIASACLRRKAWSPWSQGLCCSRWCRRRTPRRTPPPSPACTAGSRPRPASQKTTFKTNKTGILLCGDILIEMFNW